MDLFEYAESHREALEIADSIAGNRSRACDPETSREAAKNIEAKLVGLRADFVCGLRKLGGNGTANEVAVVMSDDFNVRQSIRKRASECVATGVVKVTGQRVCTISGKTCQVYEVIE